MYIHVHTCMYIMNISHIHVHVCTYTVKYMYNVDTDIVYTGIHPALDYSYFYMCIHVHM